MGLFDLDHVIDDFGDLVSYDGGLRAMSLHAYGFIGQNWFGFHFIDPI